MPISQALAGGGAKNINFNDLAADLAEITFTQPFRIPPVSRTQRGCFVWPGCAPVIRVCVHSEGVRACSAQAFHRYSSLLRPHTCCLPLCCPTQYFALIIRAIGVLEGIALVGNPEFAIVDEVRVLHLLTMRRLWFDWSACWCGLRHFALSPNPMSPPTYPPHYQAFPYIAKRLMTDSSPRLQEALRYMVRGGVSL